MSEDFHRKYRPKTFEEVIGQDAVVKSLLSLKKKNGGWPHTYLFTGPSGCGKTTLSRILASQMGVSESHIVETDAATKNGIDDMRNLTDSLKYCGFGTSPNKFIILDECHALSKAAWQSLLKVVEEPPPHVYFAFCTTEISKVPDTIQTRCHCYNLKSVGYSDLQELLEVVQEAEGLKLPDNMLRLIAKESGGSVRGALVNLSRARSVSSIEELQELLESAEGEEDVIALCRLLAGRQTPSWEAVVGIVNKMKDNTNPESCRIAISNYLASCLMRSKKEGEALKFLSLMDNFATPYNGSDKMAPLLLSLGRCLFANDE